MPLLIPLINYFIYIYFKCIVRIVLIRNVNKYKKGCNMKKLLISGVIGAVLSSSVYANDFEGVRIGAGYSAADIEDEDAGNGFKAEIGYDFNEIIGITASYEQNNDTVELPTGSVDSEIETQKIGANLGYAFELQGSYLKPYLTVGLQKLTADVMNIELIDHTGMFYGIGVRFEINHFYADLNFNKSEVDIEFIDETVDVEQTSITVGYKF